MDISKLTDADVVASTICAEAGGEPWAGKFMVGEVIANRATQSGKSLREVCLSRRQFSCWNNPNTMGRKIATMRKSADWSDCLKVANTILQPGYKATSPVTHYANLKLCSPRWIKDMRLVGVVGNHSFYVM